MQNRNEGGKEFKGVVGGKWFIIEKRGSQVINLKI
jgi:hypothetical protein